MTRISPAVPCGLPMPESPGAGWGWDLRVYHSNRLEVLAKELAGLLESDPSGPFTPERIVIPHRTTEHWLRLELARELGIAANIGFELPAEFAWSVLRGAVPSLSKARDFAPEVLRWHLFELLPDFAREDKVEAEAGARQVRRFLADGDERKRLELAEKLAGVFDRCINFREDWIREWERGATPHWQARLWRMLVDRVPERHWVHALDALERELGRKAPDAPPPRDWPRRAFVFGVSALSPSYLRLLEQLSGKIELHVFLFNPSAAYWADLRTEREIRHRTGGGDAEAQHFAVGNKLLAAWGRAGRDIFDKLIAQHDEAKELDAEPARESRLAMVQEDIREARDGDEAAASASSAAATTGEAARTRRASPDNSLQIHCCHSAMREAEVLHDRLLDLLETHPDIEPADIMILTPNPARYGPMIAAVFEAEGRIPVALSNFRAADSPTARAFFDLLSLPGTRYGVEAVLAPLDAPSLRAHFGIDENSLPAIRNWVERAGIRRGVEAGANAGTDDAQAPPIPGNTWREGLQRLLMGYAAGDTDELALGVAPCAIRGEGGFDASREKYEILGKFISYCNAAFELRGEMERPRPAKQWATLLRWKILPGFFDNGSTIGGYREVEQMREAADEFEEIGKLIDSFADQACRIDCPISFEVVRQTLGDAAADPASGPVRLADGASIGRLAQGQVLPAKIVCAVGMNGGCFPRNPPRHTFDLIECDHRSGKRRPGDRDVRHEDRYNFLEALLTARDAFIVSYSGRDQRDDAELPPSVVVDELLDYLAARFPAASPTGKTEEDRKSALESFRFEHPLQPFSQRYFTGGGKLFSYSKTMRDAAAALRGGNRKSPNRFAASLPEPDASRRTIDLDELAKFFANPARGFLNERFGIDLKEEGAAMDEVEPLEIDGLQKWSLREEIFNRTLEGRQSGVDSGSVRSLLLARGTLPFGGFGENDCDDAFAVVDAMREKLKPYAAELASEPVGLGLKLGDFHLGGAIPHVGEGRMVWWRNGKRRARDVIEIRLRQLAWMAAGKQPLPLVAISHDGEKIYSAPDSSAESIMHWLETRWRGLSKPLCFFPESSMAYAEKLGAESKDFEAAMSKARLLWAGDSRGYIPPERDDLHNRLVWDVDAAADPLQSEEFSGLAQLLLSPIFGGKPQ